MSLILLLSVVAIAVCAFYCGVMAGMGVIWDRFAQRGSAWPFDGKPKNFFLGFVWWAIGLAAALAVHVIIFAREVLTP